MFEKLIQRWGTDDEVSAAWAGRWADVFINGWCDSMAGRKIDLEVMENVFAWWTEYVECVLKPKRYWEFATFKKEYKAQMAHDMSFIRPWYEQYRTLENRALALMNATERYSKENQSCS